MYGSLRRGKTSHVCNAHYMVIDAGTKKLPGEGIGLNNKSLKNNEPKIV
jgi:hypothetical protein